MGILANRSKVFSFSLTSMTSAYTGTDQDHKFIFTSRAVSMNVVGGNVEITFTGPNASNVDFLLTPDDGFVVLPGFEAQRVSVRQASGTVTSFRFMAYK